MNNPNIVKFNINYDLIKKRYYEFLKLGEVYYPLKTNSNIELLKFLKSIFNENSGFLISHVSHFNKLREIEVEPKNMCLINVLLEDSLVKYLYDNGLRYFTFDNMNSLNKFLEYADIKESRIAVRLSISEVFKEFSHLGTNVNECSNMLKKLNEVNCKEYGLSFYLQKEVVNKENALNTMLDFIIFNFQNYKMNFINMSGSLKPNEINLDEINKLKSVLNIEKIILEPGRYLVGEFIDMETKIVKLKKVLDKNVVIVKNGIYGGLVDSLLYNKKFKIVMKTKNEEIELTTIKNKDSDYEIYLCGASSDSGDRLGVYYIDYKYKDEIKIGNTLIIKNAGAYVEEFFMPLGGDLKKEYVEIK